MAIALGGLAARHRASHAEDRATARRPSVAVEQGPIDLNAAGVEALVRLPRIGPALAQRIVEDRRLRGPFGTVEDLDRVPGIGPATLAALRPLVLVHALAAGTDGPRADGGPPGASRGSSPERDP